MCAFDAVCPAGKGAAKWRAGYGRVAEKSGSSKRFAHQGALPARRGRRSPSCPFLWRARLPFPALMNGAWSIVPPPPRPRFLPAVPQGERRALPAPAQGTNPLGIPFWGPASSFPVSRPPKRRRRQAPARGPAAVYPHRRPMRNETKHPCPLLVGHGCVFHAPKALAAGTAGALPAKGRKSSKCRFLCCIGMCTGSRLPRTCKSVQA